MSQAPAMPTSRDSHGEHLDVLLFTGAFALGLAVYFAFRALGVHQLFVTGSIIVVMLCYAGISAAVRRLRLRLDQAGDNAYYLGLLFTLVSMAVALYNFGIAEAALPDSTGPGARQIISNFGTALGSTIAGVFLRILLHQMRVDPADTESASRVELADAAARMRATLENVSLEMAHMLDVMRQRAGDSLSDLLGSTAQDSARFASSVTAITSGMMEDSARAQMDALSRVNDISTSLIPLAEEAAAAAERLRGVEGPPLKLAKRLDLVTASLESIELKVGAVNERFADAATASLQAAVAFREATATVTATLRARESETIQAGHEMVVAVSDFRQMLESLTSSLQVHEQGLNSLQESVKSSTDVGVASHKAATEVLGTLIDFSRSLSRTFKAGE